MERQDAKNIIEALLFITEQPVALKAFIELFDQEFPKDEVQAMVEEIAAGYVERASALELREIAGGWQFSTRPEFGPWIRKLFKDRLTYRLSSSAMETLSIIAYKQPITRSEIEEIRGVEVSAVLDTLTERRLIKMVGRKEAIGRPMLYGTTSDFLKSFGLKGLDALPSIESLVPPAEPVQMAAEQQELLTEETVPTEPEPAAVPVEQGSDAS